MGAARPHHLPEELPEGEVLADGRGGRHAHADHAAGVLDERVVEEGEVADDVLEGGGGLGPVPFHELAPELGARGRLRHDAHRALEVLLDGAGDLEGDGQVGPLRPLAQRVGAAPHGQRRHQAHAQEDEGQDAGRQAPAEAPEPHPILRGQPRPESARAGRGACAEVPVTSRRMLTPRRGGSQVCARGAPRAYSVWASADAGRASRPPSRTEPPTAFGVSARGA